MNFLVKLEGHSKFDENSFLRKEIHQNLTNLIGRRNGLPEKSETNYRRMSTIFVINDNNVPIILYGQAKSKEENKHPFKYPQNHQTNYGIEKNEPCFHKL